MSRLSIYPSFHRPVRSRVEAGWTTALAAVWVVLGLVAVPAVVRAQSDDDPVELAEARAFFRDNCTRCHTIGGGRLTGPDLKDVHRRQDRPWLVEFLLDPQARMDAGDPYALSLLEAARSVVMPQVAGMDAERAGSLLAMIEWESAQEDSEFSTPPVPADPFTDADRTIGRLLFSGKAPLRSGAPPCAGCHDLAGLGGWGGGRTAPDLSRWWERMGGRAAVADWLQSSGSDPYPAAAFVHRPMETSEIHPLSAALEAAARSGPGRPARHQLVFSASGWLAAAIVLSLLAALTSWLRRADADPIPEPATAAWAKPCLLLGLAAVAAFHLLALLAPAVVLDWTHRPRSLWGVETAQLAAGLLALFGLLSSLGRRRDADDGKRIADGLLVACLAVNIATGVLLAVDWRWGLPWMAGWLRPGIAGWAQGDIALPELAATLSPVLRLHVAASLAALVLLPFTRWRRYLHPRTLDPRRIPWRRLDPRRRLSSRDAGIAEPTEESA